MCKQLKTGYTDCPHVECDHDVLPCNDALEAQAAKIESEGETEVGNSFCDTIKWEWKQPNLVGKCNWCAKAEGDKGKAERRRMKKFGVNEQGKTVKEKGWNVWE